MSSTGIGCLAEVVAADYLIKNKYKIVDKNWRTRVCEIDIIAEKNKIVYFVEVKYRKTDSWGDGIDAITTKKMKQMTFASKIWINQNNWESSYELAVISVSGKPMQVDDFLII